MEELGKLWERRIIILRSKSSWKYASIHELGEVLSLTVKRNRGRELEIRVGWGGRLSGQG